VTDLTVQLALTLALSCSHGADPRLINAIALHESGGRPEAVSPPNRNGTIDIGLMQINSANLARFGLTPQTALDPCRSADAAVRHLTADSGEETVQPGAVSALLQAIARYNPGDPTYPAKITALMQGSTVPTVTQNKPSITPQLTIASQFPAFRRK
jgi:soluble lytic murein transglycosylase-like protein